MNLNETLRIFFIFSLSIFLKKGTLPEIDLLVLLDDLVKLTNTKNSSNTFITRIENMRRYMST